MKKVIAVILTATLAIGLVGCSTSTQVKKHENETLKNSESIDKNSDKEDISKEPIDKTEVDVSSITELSKIQWDMVSNGENVNFSPASLKYAMAMLQAGSDVETAEKIGCFLGEEDIENYKDSIRNLKESEVVEIANAMFAQTGFNINDEYKDIVEKYFLAEANEVDFTTDEAQEKINKWVSKNTHGLIESMPAPTSTKVALLNAVYFKDSWDMFDENSTSDDVFHGSNGDTTIPMMNAGLGATNSIHLGNTYSALTLNMDKSDITIYLPNENVSIEEVAEELKDKNETEEVYDEVYVTLPKFKFEGTMKLNDIVKAAGLGEIFEGGNGMFSNISNADLFVDQIVQKSTIDLNEKGVEASAVTEILVMETSIMVPTDTYSFVVNKPFLYEINCNDETLFIGCVSSIGE